MKVCGVAESGGKAFPQVLYHTVLNTTAAVETANEVSTCGMTLRSILLRGKESNDLYQSFSARGGRGKLHSIVRRKLGCDSGSGGLSLRRAPGTKHVADTDGAYTACRTKALRTKALRTKAARSQIVMLQCRSDVYRQICRMPSSILKILGPFLSLTLDVCARSVRKSHRMHTARKAKRRNEILQKLRQSQPTELWNSPRRTDYLPASAAGESFSQHLNNFYHMRHGWFLLQVDFVLCIRCVLRSTDLLPCKAVFTRAFRKLLTVTEHSSLVVEICQVCRTYGSSRSGIGVSVQHNDHTSTCNSVHRRSVRTHDCAYS